MGGVTRTRSLKAASGDACLDGAQPPRGSVRVLRGLGDPLPPTTPAVRLKHVDLSIELETLSFYLAKPSSR